MGSLQEVLQTMDGFLGGGNWFIVLLLGTGIFFTILLKFPQIRLFHYSTQALRGKFDMGRGQGDTSHFQALTTALSGTVGTGNIAGVAFAIHLGGPAALFWMIMTAVIGMTTKFVEVTLSHRYREFAEDGSVQGGPMYYMKNGLGWGWVATLFAGATVVCSFGTGNMPQISSIADAMDAVFHLDRVYVGLVLTILLGLVVLGGIKRIAKVTEKLVPTMAGIYLIGALFVIVHNAENIWPSLQAVLGDVFTGSAAMGGFLGSSISFAMSRGVSRGLFSNEAGQGSAPIVHASAQTDEPVSEGLVALLEPFIDTIVICSITGLVILSSGVWNEKVENTFQYADMCVLEGAYDDTQEADQLALFSFMEDAQDLPLFSGYMEVIEGVIQDTNVTILHARSLAEDVLVQEAGLPLTGKIRVEAGRVKSQESFLFRGKSLVHSTQLTTEAFSRSALGAWGGGVVAIGILLFAFSTAISWSYYGTRAMAYLFGIRYNKIYLLIYVCAFFIASIVDTTIIWDFSAITIVIMTVPNLIALLFLFPQMREELKRFLCTYSKKNKKN